MTEAEKICIVKAVTGETDEATVLTYLNIAGSKIYHKAYPFGETEMNVPPKYDYTQVEIAVYLLNKRGAEGQTAHSENGISRTYENADIPASLLREVVPMASVIGGGSYENHGAE